MRHPVEAGGVLVQPGFMVEVSDADSPSPSLQKVALVFALAAVVAMGLIVVLSGAAGRRLTTELRSLRDFANAVVSEGFSERRLAVHGGDEVAEVASAVNYMVNRLSELHAAEQNEARHKLDVERDKLLAAQRIGRLGNWDYHYDTDEITCSDEVFRITGLDKGETGSVPLPQLLSLLASEDQAKVLRALAHPKTGTTLELRLQRSGAPARHLSVTFGETEFLAGEPASVGGVLQDVTDAREAERRLAEKTRELEKVNADLQAFAYVASHDLRQPLRMVTSYLTLLERSLGPGLADEPAQFVAYARDGATRMDRLIVDLLEYSRSGRADHGEDVDLGAAAAEALTNLKWNLEEAGASVELAPDAPVVHGNAGELTRLFQNLVGNAIKYRSPERPPRIAIGWRRNGDEVMVQVEDNGIGIPPEHADRVFGIFQRLHTTQEYEGSGIGLAICKKVVESHGGRIWLASEPDRGTTFFAAFPTA
ncbi:MAG: sensor histidine kinase, partial [Actinomycetota bacterium]